MKNLKYIIRIITASIIITIISIIYTTAVYLPTPTNVLEQKYIENEDYTYYIDTDILKAVIIDIKSGTKIFDVPETVTYKNTVYPVVAISISSIEGYSDFYKSIKTINASKNLKEIHISLFGEQGSNPDKLNYLERINIPNDSELNSIYLGFCPKLKKINFNSNSKLNDIYILSCPKLKSVYIPKSVTMIGFSNCPNLKMTISKDNPKYKMRNTRYLCSKNGKTIYEYYGKQKSVKIPKGAKTLNGVYSESKYIKKVTIPASVKSIKNYTFSDCKKLSKVVINNKKKSPKIEKNAFKNTPKGIKFYVKNKKVAKSLKKQLKGSGVKKAKIYIGKTLIYKNIK